ncbi:hypothetical protein Tco_1033354, partial [Tanacetum coccineum]
ASECAPYTSCLPRVEVMHSTLLGGWNDDGLYYSYGRQHLKNKSIFIQNCTLHCVTKPVVKSIKRSSARESCLDVEDLVIVALVNA